jgi:hypothetical protein
MDIRCPPLYDVDGLNFSDYVRYYGTYVGATTPSP